MLPESQAIVYVNLSPLRAATHFDRRPVAHDPGYQRFIESTGIDFERDLNEAAFALHRLPDLTGPNGGLAFSEVFAGRFDPERLARYLAGIAASTETYDGHTIFSVPSQGRTVRVAVLPAGVGQGMVAISNTPTPEQIHSMLDRARTAWLPFGGPSPTLLHQYYGELPVLALAWGLGEIGLPFADSGELRVFGFPLPWRVDTVFVASLRWTGAIRLRVEEIAPSQATASASAQALAGLLGVLRLAETNLPAQMTDAGLLTFVNSATVTHVDNKAVLNATLPESLLRSVVRAPDALTSGSFNRRGDPGDAR